MALSKIELGRKQALKKAARDAEKQQKAKLKAEDRKKYNSTCMYWYCSLFM